MVVGENVNFSSFAEGVMASQGVQVHLLQVKENINLDSQKLIKDHPIRGAVKKKILVFFDFLSKGGRGGLGQSKKSLSENTQIFLTKGGRSYPIQKGFFSEKN